MSYFFVLPVIKKGDFRLDLSQCIFFLKRKKITLELSAFCLDLQFSFSGKLF